uniref:Matrilin-4 n=1 Tax=Nomascus leucogenys TaxID=61853 RepID=A0A2I3HWE4_NOMLE
MRGLLCWPVLLLLLQPWETQLQLAGPRCHTGPLDLVFVIDSSRSVRPFEFETMRQFLMGLLRGLNVGPNATRVGVIQYSSQVQSVFPLRAFSRREDMERAIRDLVPLAQGTMTGLAIQYAMNVAFSVAEGARPPEERVPRVAVIVTDGRPQDRVAEVAAQARARGIEIYAVGVQRADVGSLRAMASPPLDEHVFLVESFDLIQEFGLQFQSRLCAIDLCAEGTHGCEHHCINSPGSYFCRCQVGFVLQQDQRSCRALGHSCQHDVEGHDLQPDGRSCQVRDLCNGVDHGCEFQCVSEGLSYRCLCPEGRQIQADGKGCNRDRDKNFETTALGHHNLASANSICPSPATLEHFSLTGLPLPGCVRNSPDPKPLHVLLVGIVMYAVGVGKAVEAELREIASEPAELHVSYAPDFGTMTHLLENLRGSICPEEGISAGTELRSPCECESLVEFQGRTLGAGLLNHSLAQLTARLEDLENQLANQK